MSKAVEMIDLFGMAPKMREYRHSYTVPMSEVLQAMAKDLKKNGLDGYIISIHTELDYYDEDGRITTLTFSPQF